MPTAQFTPHTAHLNPSPILLLKAGSSLFNTAMSFIPSARCSTVTLLSYTVISLSCTLLSLYRSILSFYCLVLYCHFTVLYCYFKIFYSTVTLLSILYCHFTVLYCHFTVLYSTVTLLSYTVIVLSYYTPLSPYCPTCYCPSMKSFGDSGLLYFWCYGTLLTLQVPIGSYGGMQTFLMSQTSQIQLV